MLTERQLKMRRTGLGASVSAAPSGRHPYVTPFDLVAETLYGVRRPATAAMEAGEHLEDGICRMYEKATGERLWRCPTRRHPLHHWMLATVDRRCVRAGRRGKPVEAKAIGRRGDEWGYGADEFPPYIHFQVQQQMEVTGEDEADVVAFFLQSRELAIYPVQRNQRFIDAMIEYNGRWWQRHIVEQLPVAPIDGSDGAALYLREVFKRPSGEVVVAPPGTDEYARGYAQALEDLREAEGRKAYFGNQLRAVIGDNAGVADYWGKATWKPQRGQPSWKAVAQEYRTMLELRGLERAELDEVVSRQTSDDVRVLRVRLEEEL